MHLSQNTSLTSGWLLTKEFDRTLMSLKTGDARNFHLRYLLAKLTQYVDLQAYGPSELRNQLSDYTSGGNDSEHILPDQGHAEAVSEVRPTRRRPGHHSMLKQASIDRKVDQPFDFEWKILRKDRSLPSIQVPAHQVPGQHQGPSNWVCHKITRTVQSLKCWPSWNAIEGESIFGAKASFGLQGLAAEDRITLRFRFRIPSADEL